jgi:hypothetical protein
MAKNRPNGQKIPTSFIGSPSKIYPNLHFGLKIYHLATLFSVGTLHLGLLRVPQNLRFAF